MRHHINIVARNFGIDKAKFEQYALGNITKFGLENDNGFITVSTSRSEDLVEAFKYHDGLYTMYTSAIEKETEFMKIVLKRAIHQLDNYLDPKKVEQRVVELEKLWLKFL